MVETMGDVLVGMPTRDGQALIQTLHELIALGHTLRVPVHFLVGEAGNIPRSRNLVMEQARARSFGSRTAWILWIDSDILIPRGGNVMVAEAIRWSWETKNAWAASYRMANGQSVLMRDHDGGHYTPEELASLPAWAPIAMSGLGCAFVQMDLDYVFHADVLGEDVHFFRDHPNLDLHYARDVRVNHRKVVTL